MANILRPSAREMVIFRRSALSFSAEHTTVNNSIKLSEPSIHPQTAIAVGHIYMNSHIIKHVKKTAGIARMKKSKSTQRRCVCKSVNTRLLHFSQSVGVTNTTSFVPLA